MPSLLRATAVLAVVLAFGVITAEAATTRTFVGETKAVGNGTIHTWLTEDASGRPLALGVTFTKGIMSGLPDTLPNTEYVVALPKEALATTPFTQFALNWNPHGHVPKGIYNVPHFDFHFYLISPATRAAMGPGEEAQALVTPPADAIPPGYITAPGAFEPHMGNHWVNQNAPEFHGKPFRVTFVYGYYDGKMAFLEPMMTPVYLRTKPSFDQVIPLPALYPKPGYYPTRYSVRYDAANGEYTVALEGLTKR